MKTRDKFINACFVVWGNRASGKNITADSVLKEYNIGSNASKFITSIKGLPEECSREYFADLYRQYSKENKKYNEKKEAPISADLLRGRLTYGVSCVTLNELQSGKKRGRPKNENSDSETRMTFVVNKVQLEKIREIAYRHNLYEKDILYHALGEVIREYEEKHGEVIPRGKSKLF